jgi:tripartite-type tricarboxylate transporter receptor subunit TctC
MSRAGGRGRALRLGLAVTLTLAAWSRPSEAADAVESFYAGRTLTLLIGYSAGGGYDVYARVLARHMGDHIPGKPSIVPQNMPGAGSLRLANYLAAIALKDGSVFATFGRGMAMEPLLNPGTTNFDAQKLTWIGSITNEVSVCAFRSDSGIATWKDMTEKSFTLGGTGSGSDTDIFPNVLGNMFHLKMKLATGYPGGSDVVLALERGEINGRCGWSWSSLQSRNKAMYDSHEINIPLQLALQGHPDLPDVPLITELTKDPKEIAALRLIFSRQSMARPFVGPPGIPEARKQALREAFDATMKDPAFLDEAKKNDLEVLPVSGDAIEKLVKETYASPKDVITLAQQAIKDMH